jgi:hypothetical protein
VYTIIDAEYPPTSIPEPATGILGYIGGPKAANTWSLTQWERFSHVRQFPAYVPDMAANPLPQAEDAVTRALALGWAPWQKGNGERAIIFDLETGANPEWWLQLARMTCTRGFVPVAYGSQSTVYANQAAAVIMADWTGHVPTGGETSTTHGIQYEANVTWEGTKIDYSVFDQWLFDRAGVGPRHN